MPNTDRINVRAAINHIRIESSPYFHYSGKGEIIPWGIDNLYPSRIIQAIKKSPTARGCVKRQSEFIFGQGLRENGNIVVNREGETLNDIVWQSIRNGYSELYGFGVHVNFNAFGEICELFAVKPEYIRKHRNQRKAEYSIWEQKNHLLTDAYNEVVDLYGEADPMEGISKHGVRGYKGQLMFFSKDREIYPESPIDSASMSASFEKEAQTYPLANIKNGFSGNTIIKYPSIATGTEDGDEEADNLEEKIRSVHGAERAGSSVVVSVPVSTSGEPKEFKMVEHLSPTNVDDLFENQNTRAERNILKNYLMPEILLGASSQGMFNEAEFNDAFNYKNSDVEHDRNEIERFFDKVLPKTIWKIDHMKLLPMEMRGTKINENV